jgi:hypothetical protein
MGVDWRAGRFFRKFERIGSVNLELLLDVSRGRKTARDFSLFVGAHLVKEGFCSFMDFFSMKDEVFFEMIEGLMIWKLYERSSSER